MTGRQMYIAQALIRLLLVQGGDCRARDYVVDDRTVAGLLEEYDPLTPVDWTPAVSPSLKD